MSVCFLYIMFTLSTTQIPIYLRISQEKHNDECVKFCLLFCGEVYKADILSTDLKNGTAELYKVLKDFTLGVEFSFMHLYHERLANFFLP